MRFIEALAAVILRLLIAAFVGSMAAVVVAFAGVAGGSGPTGIFLAAVVVFFGLGWSLLPAIRESPVLAFLAACAWCYLGFRLSQFGAQHVRGWMIYPWLLSTCGVFACLVHEPPRYVRWDTHRSTDRSDVRTH